MVLVPGLFPRFDPKNGAPAHFDGALAPSGSGATAQEVWEYDVSAMSTAGYAGTYLDFLFDVAEGDSYIDTATTPWDAVIHMKGDSGTELVRKELYDVSGGNISSVTTVIGKQLEPE